MEITSFYFLCFYAIVLLLYYIVPGKLQWLVLTGASIAFYLLSGNVLLVLYPLAAVFVTWVLLLMLKRAGKENLRSRRVLLAAETAALLGVLAILKYTSFIGIEGILVPLGLSFYTFIILGYFIDCYNGICEIQTSFFKTALYGMFFPLMISGPIVPMRDYGEQFFKPHKLKYENITFGMQRMLWGFFKELVISKRLALVVNTVYGNDTAYNGPYIWLAAVCFSFQLYTNFSGCMDIVIGLSETFGLRLPENFDTPFLAKSISEYWRRWHITLGVWMKEHVFYPILKSELFIKQAAFFKSRFGKKRGKKLNTYLAMLILWSAVGLWHGGHIKYIIGSGVLHWFYIVMGECTLPFWTWLFAEKMHINMKSRFSDVIRVIRTFFLVNIGFVFFEASSVGQALRMLREGLMPGDGSFFMSEGIFKLGLDPIEWTITLFSLTMLIITSVIQYRKSKASAEKGIEYDYHGIRKSIAGKRLPVRWLLWMSLLFFVILLGEYGPGYSATEFIYQGF